MILKINMPDMVSSVEAALQEHLNESLAFCPVEVADTLSSLSNVTIMRAIIGAATEGARVSMSGIGGGDYVFQDEDIDDLALEIGSALAKTIEDTVYGPGGVRPTSSQWVPGALAGDEDEEADDGELEDEYDLEDELVSIFGRVIECRAIVLTGQCQLVGGSLRD